MRESDLDAIEATKAPLIEHLAELRTRLIRAGLVFIVVAVLTFIFRQEVFQFLIYPLKNVDPNAQVSAGSPQDVFFQTINLAIWGGFFFGFPLIAAQLWGFVAPGLYAEEKSAFLPFLLATPFLFTAGAALAYFFVIPMALGWLLEFNRSMAGNGAIQIEQINLFKEYSGFIKTLLFAFGVSFQLPALLLLLGRAGMVSAEALGKGRKYAVVGIAFVSMLLTPPDPISMIALGVPVYLLYEISIHLVKAFEKKRAAELAEEV